MEGLITTGYMAPPGTQWPGGDSPRPGWKAIADGGTQGQHYTVGLTGVGQRSGGSIMGQAYLHFLLQALYHLVLYKARCGLNACKLP